MTEPAEDLRAEVDELRAEVRRLEAIVREVLAARDTEPRNRKNLRRSGAKLNSDTAPRAEELTETDRAAARAAARRLGLIVREGGR